MSKEGAVEKFIGITPERHGEMEETAKQAENWCAFKDYKQTQWFYGEWPEKILWGEAKKKLPWREMPIEWSEIHDTCGELKC